MNISDEELDDDPFDVEKERIDELGNHLACCFCLIYKSRPISSYLGSIFKVQRHCILLVLVELRKKK
jgi:hypothetical protein